MSTENQEYCTEKQSSEDDKLIKLRKEKRKLVAENKNLSHELDKSRGFANFLQYVMGMNNQHEKDKEILILNDKLQKAISILELKSDHQEILDMLHSDIDFSESHSTFEAGVKEGDEFFHRSEKENKNQ